MLITTVNSALQIIQTVCLYSDVDELSAVDCRSVTLLDLCNIQIQIYYAFGISKTADV